MLQADLWGDSYGIQEKTFGLAYIIHTQELKELSLRLEVKGVKADTPAAFLRTYSKTIGFNS